MEQLSDIDDFVPPTPKNQTKKKIIGNALNLENDSRAGGKLNLKSIQNSKRKKISGVSPEFKKFKQKAKQVSIFNYMKRENSPIKMQSNSKSESLVSRPAKIRLFNEPSSRDTTNNVCSNPEISIEKQINPKTNNIIFNVKENISNPAFSDKTLTSEHVNSNIANENTFIIPKVKISDHEICEDVKNLILHFDDRSKIADDTSPENILQAFSDVKEKPNGTNLSVQVDKLSDIEQSFSWMDDLDWKTCDDSIENELSVTEKCHPVKTKVNSGNILENSILFTITRVHRTACNEIKLSVKALNTVATKTCILRGFWADTLVAVGDNVHILAEFENNEAVVDNHSGFIVTNPDFLMSSTAVVSTLFCMRKAALNHILPSWSPGNKVMMVGSLVHDIFQQAVNSHLKSKEEIERIAENVLKKRDTLISLSCQETPESEIKEKVFEYIPGIVLWIRKHCAFKGMTASDNIQVTSVQGIEDNVWCPKYGIKGKIDMTVKATFRDQGINRVLPLELKTGRATYSAEHTGQINLYTLMMEERTKQMSDGLLLYLKDAANMKVVAANHNSRRGLIQLRNELSFYTHKWISRTHSASDDIEQCHLPKPINSKKFCEKCPYQLPCTVYQKAYSEDKLLENGHAMNSLIPSSTSHLSSNHLEYFIHWSTLLLLESASAAITNAFWMEEAASREKKGMCLSWLSLVNNVKSDIDVNEVFCVNTFSRSSSCPLTTSLTNVGLRVGDYVAISNQRNFDEVAIAMGYILQINEQFAKVASERDLSTVPEYENYTFRIDKQVSNTATACIRNNLMRLMENDEKSMKLRSFIVDKAAPNFVTSLSKDVVLRGRSILKALNKVQQRVILKSLMAEDYFIIKGMPGTGKTSTIVALVRLLVEMGISVFLTSYTHSAIDNILLKLKEHMGFVRIGQEARIHPNLKRFSFENLTKDFTTVDQFKLFMKKQMVVAATCLGINHPIFKVRSFDVCIVDEASQINQIACIGPLFHAKKFILVGDDKQLPPLVVNEKAREKGMQESLLQRLCTSDNCMELVIQYRMNNEIMRLCNELTYNGTLQCGSEFIAQAVLRIDIPKNGNNSTPSWMVSALSGGFKKSVILINTDQVNAVKMDKSQGFEKNNFEADLVMELLQYLIEGKVPECDIGVITPYRRQVDLIESQLKSKNLNEIEVNTVDQYQGRDKCVIIISCVKSSKSSSACEKKGVILNDDRRLNVAISRAKKKLIIVGCKSTLVTYKPFKMLINCLQDEQILDLSPDTFSAHK